MSQTQQSDMQHQADLLRFTLDIYLNTLIREYPDILTTACFRNFLTSLHELLEEVEQATREEEGHQTGLLLAIKEMQKIIREKGGEGRNEEASLDL